MQEVDIGKLTLQISADATSASAGIDKLKTSLNGLKSALSGLTGFAEVSSQLSQLTKGLSSLSAIGDMGNFKQAASSIKSTVKALSELQNVNVGSAKKQLKEVASALSVLTEVGKASGFTSTINSLKKLPQVAQDLDKVDMKKFAERCKEAATAIEPLATQMAKIGPGLGSLTGSMNTFNSSAKSTNAVLSKLESGFNRLFSVMMVRRIARGLSNLIKKATAYVEDLNLFTVAMGKYAEEAQKYAETVSETMGIDVAAWLRAQGVFQTLATGFGVSADRAAIMSKNLTQLAYDISSFYNLKIEDAMQKLQSGFAGEIEPVRRLGYDLSKTTLQATAASLGITKLFADMTQAEKSQLRYYAMMTQVTQVQGDMARTLNAPANQLRIFSAQLEMAKRSLGNIFIPALNAVLPYVIAFIKLVRLAADAVAQLFGYELPEIDYSSVSDGIAAIDEETEDLDDSLNAAHGSAKKLKGLLASFDELNIIQSETGGGSGSGGSALDGITDGWQDFELPEYNFLSGMLESQADKIFKHWKEKLHPLFKWLKDNFNAVWGIVKAIGLGLLAWRLTKNFGLGLAITGFAIEYQGAFAIGHGDAKLIDYIKTAVGAALGIAGSLLLFGTGPAGWIIGIGVALGILIKGITAGADQKAIEEIRAGLDAAFKEAFNGAIDSEEYAQIVSDRMAEISASLSFGIQLQAEVDADHDALGETVQLIGDYRLKLGGVGKLTEDEVGQMNEAFKLLDAEGKTYLEGVFDVLENGLIKSLQVLPEEAQTAVTGYLTALEPLKESAMTDLERETEAYRRAMENAQNAASGSAEQQKYLEEAFQHAQAISILTGTAIDATNTLRSAMIRANADIEQVHFEDMDSVMTFLSRVEEAYKESAEKINSYWSGEIDKAQTQLDYANWIGDADAAAAYAGMIELFQQSRQTMLSQLDEVYKDQVDDVVGNMVDYSGREWKEAWDKHTEGTWFTNAVDWLGNQSGSVMSSIFGSDYTYNYGHNYLQDKAIDKFFPEATAHLKKVAETLKKSASPVAKELGKNVLDALGDGMTPDEFGKWGNKLKEGLNVEIEDTKPTLAKSVVDAVNSTANILADAAKGTLDNIGKDSRPHAFGVGGNIGRGVFEGMHGSISGSQGLIVNGIRNSFNEMRPTLEGMADSLGRSLGRGVGNGMTGALSNVGRQILDWWGRFALPVPRVAPNNGSANPADWLNVPVPAFAGGGFPTSGALFIAGENPELVGTMGGRTAVANSDQIVTGIAYGVSQANGEQNRLLREQNSLLRQLVAQGGKVVFSPSPEAGRVVEMSLDMYATQRGY